MLHGVVNREITDNSYMLEPVPISVNGKTPVDFSGSWFETAISNIVVVCRITVGFCGFQQNSLGLCGNSV